MALWKLLHLYCLVIWLLKRQHCGNMYTLAHKLSQRRKKRQTEKEWPPKVRKQNSCCLFRNFFIPEIRLSPSESPPLFQVVNAFRPLTVVCNQCVWVCLWSAQVAETQQTLLRHVQPPFLLPSFSFSRSLSEMLELLKALIKNPGSTSVISGSTARLMTSCCPLLMILCFLNLLDQDQVKSCIFTDKAQVNDNCKHLCKMYF